MYHGTKRSLKELSNELLTIGHHMCFIAQARSEIVDLVVEKPKGSHYNMNGLQRLKQPTFTELIKYGIHQFERDPNNRLTFTLNPGNKFSEEYAYYQLILDQETPSVDTNTLFADIYIPSIQAFQNSEIIGKERVENGPAPLAVNR